MITSFPSKHGNKSQTHASLHCVIYQVSSDGKQNQSYHHRQTTNTSHTCTYIERTVMTTHTPSAVPMNFMALLEPSCSLSNILTSQLCGNPLPQLKDVSSLAVIKPIKNRLIMPCQIKIEILWSAVSQSTMEALPNYFFNISMRDSVSCSEL